MNQDEEHLRLLSIFHYVVSGIIALFACFPCIHLAVGIGLVSGTFHVQPGQEGPALFLGSFFIVIPVIVILTGWSLAVAIFVAGKFLSERTHYTYCMVVAAIECALMPFGTALGVFTIVVLNRSSVRALFQTADGAAG